MLECDAEVISAKMMHADAFIEFIFASIDPSQSNASTRLASYTQVLWSDILMTVVSNCGTAFRSKFVITLQGMVRLLTLVDAQLDSEAEIDDTNLELVQNVMDALAMLLVDDAIKENAGIFQEARGF